MAIVIIRATECDNSDIQGMPNSLVVEFEIDGYPMTLGFDADATKEDVFAYIKKKRTNLLADAKRAYDNKVKLERPDIEGEV